MSKEMSCQSTGTGTSTLDLDDTRMATLPSKTAGWCTKYVSTAKLNEESDSDSDFEVEATDNLLGRLRRGIQVIETHARETMANCDTDEMRFDMAGRLEKSTLGMLRAEKSFLSTSRIIAEVVDEFASDYEDEEIEPQEKPAHDHGDDGKLLAIAPEPTIPLEPESGDTDIEVPEEGSESPVVPVFRPTMANSASIRNFALRLTNILKERVNDYEVSLTDDVLKCEKKFQALQEQITSGNEDAIRRNQSTTLDENSCMHSTPPEDTKFDSEDDEEDYDESVLPSTDPITLQPIFTAVRNKLCNHVFENLSITTFMAENPTATCPMMDCRNQVPLMKEHFILEKKLTNQIRLKNDKLYDEFKM